VQLVPALALEQAVGNIPCSIAGGKAHRGAGGALANTQRSHSKGSTCR
jgi:hypothetical protein